MKYLNSKEVSEILGVNISTLKRWTDSGKLDCVKTAGGHRKFTLQHVRNYYKSNGDGFKSSILAFENKKHKILYDLINKQDYKSLSIKLADYSLDSDDESVSTIVNGLYMNGTAVSDLLDYVIDIAGHIVENKLATDEISHADAYLSRKILTRAVDSLNGNKPNGTFNGKNALCVNFEENLPDIGVVMSEVLLRHQGYNVYNTGSHAHLGDLESTIQKRNVDLVLFYLCNLQCCNAILAENISKTIDQINDTIILSKKIGIRVLFGGEGFFLLNDIKDKVEESFLTYSDLSKLI